MIKYSGQTISGMHYSGYTIVRAYGCGGELVFGTTPPTPTGTKVIYTISGTSYTIPCDYDPVIDKMEILQDMSRRGLPIQDETSAMTDVVIGDCVTTISANTFNECEAVTSFTISNSVTSIGHDAFKDCIVLPSIVLPSGITTIEDGLFENDFQLSAVTIPSGVTAISESAFYDNISLLNIEIPSGVTSIGMGAFRCSYWTNPQWKRDKMLQVASGRSVTIYATVPPTLEQGDEFSIFTGSDDIATYPIYVPCESVDAYKAAWSQYASRIKGIGSFKSPEYISRTSVAKGYVPLGEYFQENTVIEIDFQMTHPNGYALIGDYMCNDNDDWRVFINFANQSNNLLVYDFLNSRTSMNMTSIGGTTARYHLEIGNYYIKNLADDSYLINQTPKSGFNRPNQMYLLSFDKCSSVTQNNTDYGNVYSIKIYQDGVLVKDFIPWTDGNGNYGLFDKVGKNVHNSVGTMTGSVNTTDICP